MSTRLWTAPLFGLIACSGYDSLSTGGPAPTTPPSGSSDPATGSQHGGLSAQSGQLTAGAWDDNLNFEFFQRFLAETHEAPARWESSDRVVIQIQDGSGAPLPGARVSIDQLLDQPTGSDGRVLLFPAHDQLTASQVSIDVQAPDGTRAHFDQPVGGSKEWTLAVPGSQASLPNALDLAFIVDTTGSMGDEIAYLQAEIGEIVLRIRAGNVPARFALLVYRDRGDLYLTRKFDFTASAETFEQALAGQSADGGGDYPESLDVAMAEADHLSWSSGNSARMAFVIADAPPHSADAPAYLAAVDRLRRRGVHIYPVGASGVAEEAEYLFRVSAEATLGRYLFLTDDSGIGDPHQVPHIPCFRVEHLNWLLVRMVASELAGHPIEPPSEQILRTVGSPDAAGVCTLADGSQLQDL